MYLTGFADEAAQDIEDQIRATQALGWHNIEARKIGGTIIADIPDKEFNRICDLLGNAGIRINCFGSAVANWQKSIFDPPDSSYEELKRAIPRMHKLGARLIRIMSFQVADTDARLENTELSREVFRRMKEIVKIASDGGVVPVHENCMCWGGRSWEHTLRLLEEIPSLKLVFDTGNPVFNRDVRGNEPWQYQDAFEFYDHVKEHIAYVHIKDAKQINGTTTFTHAGDGDGHVRKILADLHARGYNGGISIEPHLAVVLHDNSVLSSKQVQFDNYVEYGKRVEKMIREIGWSPEN